jgi:hypothetical protein
VKTRDDRSVVFLGGGTEVGIGEELLQHTLVMLHLVNMCYL